MLPTPLISVIIPVYNRASDLNDCLTSLYDQSYPNLEIIVVNDQSTDNSKEVALKHRVKIVDSFHRGVGEARNLGAKQAAGSILIFVDSDMKFHEEFIANLIKPILIGEALGTNTNEEYLANPENQFAVAFNYIFSGNPHRRVPLNAGHTSPVYRAILTAEFNRVNGYRSGGYNDDWSLSEKLKVPAQIANNAIMYHKNPDTLRAIFKQSIWIGDRPYKLGLLGSLIALIRSFLPFSFIVSIYLCLKYRYLKIIPVKVVSDLGIFIGIIKSIFSNKKP